jgi:hypothetical protein
MEKKEERDGKEKRNKFQHMQKYQTCYVCDMADRGMSKLEWYCEQEQLCNSKYMPHSCIYWDFWG